MSVNIVNKSTGALTKIAGNPVEQASGISYDHTSSGMQANNVQAAVDELRSGLTNLTDDVKLNTQDLTTVSRTKNLLPITVSGIKEENTTGTWNGDTYTENGIDFTIQKDSDGKVTGITANGTASDETYFVFAGNDKLKSLAGNNLVLNGSIGGANETYLIQAVAYNGVNSTASRNGDSLSFTPTSAFSQVRIIIMNGATVDNVNFYPMLRLASITDNTFAPYIPSVESRIEAVESGVDLTTSVIAGEHVTIDTTTAYVIKVGGIVVCMLSLTANQDLSINDEILITNMPKPSKVRIVYIVYGSKQFQCAITTSGVFKFTYSDNTLQSGETAKMSFIYPL